MPDKKPRVLIVDDEVPICELLFEELTSRGYDCEMANNAAEALSTLQAARFDAALLDIRLPDMSGIELLKRINKSYSGTVSIMLTAVNELEVAVQTMKAGAADYITKPFDLERVDSALQAALNSRDPGHQDPGLSARNAAISEIEAISLGVEARQEMLDVHSEKVIQQTISIARQLGLSEEKIQQWLAFKAEQQSRKTRQVADSISKLMTNPPVQKDSPL